MIARLPDGTTDRSSFDAWNVEMLSKEKSNLPMIGKAKIDQPRRGIKRIGITTLIIGGIVIYWILK